MNNKISILFLGSILFLNCNTIRNKRLFKDNSRLLLKTHALLMKESKLFLTESSQNNFSESVYDYIKNLK